MPVHAAHEGRQAPALAWASLLSGIELDLPLLRWPAPPRACPGSPGPGRATGASRVVGAVNGEEMPPRDLALRCCKNSCSTAWPWGAPAMLAQGWVLCGSSRPIGLGHWPPSIAPGQARACRLAGGGRQAGPRRSASARASGHAMAGAAPRTPADLLPAYPVLEAPARHCQVAGIGVGVAGSFVRGQARKGLQCAQAPAPRHSPRPAQRGATGARSRATLRAGFRAENQRCSAQLGALQARAPARTGQHWALARGVLMQRRVVMHAKVGRTRRRCRPWCACLGGGDAGRSVGGVLALVRDPDERGGNHLSACAWRPWRFRCAGAMCSSRARIQA